MRRSPRKSPLNNRYNRSWDSRNKLFLDLSAGLQNLITQTVIQTRQSTNLDELKKKIQSIYFVRGNGYDYDRQWFCFDKQWLYEQILAPTPDDDFFVIQGTSTGKFENKNDAELRTFLQQLGEMTVDIPANNYFSSRSAQSGIQSFSQPHSQSTSSEIPTQSNLTDCSSNSSSTNSNYSQDNPTTEQKISKKTKDEEINLETNSSSPKINSEKEQLNNQPSSEQLEQINELKKPNDFSLLIERGEKSDSKKEVEEASSNSEKINQSLALSKQEVINQIKNQLAQNPDLKNSVGRKYQNWEKDIEQLTNQQEVLAYQTALLQTIKKEQNLKLTIKEASFEPKTNHKNNTIVLIIAGVFLLSAFLGYLFWKKSSKK